MKIQKKLPKGQLLFHIRSVSLGRLFAPARHDSALRVFGVKGHVQAVRYGRLFEFRHDDRVKLVQLVLGIAYDETEFIARQFVGLEDAELFAR